MTRPKARPAIPGPRLRDALDDDGDGQADEGLLDAIIASVDGAVDAYLAGLYDVPFATPPAPVIEASLVFACERIYDRRPGAEDRNPWRSRADWWRERLERIGKGDTLVVWKLDRLARSLKDLVEIVHDLNQRSVGFRSLTEVIDTTSSGGRLVFHIFGALAEFEHSLIRERTIAGLVAARARGRKGGRKPVMSKADTRKAAAMLSDPNITKAEVARHFSVSRVTLNAALAREGYAGTGSPRPTPES